MLPYHGSRGQIKVLHYLQLKQNIMVHLKEQKKITFVKNIIESISELLRLQLPMALRMDNTGAIYLAYNQTTGQRTKHIDIRVHHVRHLITYGIIKTKFFGTDDNTADIFKKNTSETLFVKHSDKLIEDLEELYEELPLGFEYSE
jgi:hypothetical protein